MSENQEIGDVPAVEAPEEPVVAVSSRPRRMFAHHNVTAILLCTTRIVIILRR